MHNGIIENSEEIKKTLLGNTVEFESQTDTEVFVHLIEKYYTGDPITAIAKALAVLKGAYAFGILCTESPGLIFSSSSGSPLVVAKSDNGNYIASDSDAIPQKNKLYRLKNGEICKLTVDSAEFYDPSGEKIIKKEETGFNTRQEVDKGKYEHFMLKEIFEQPQAVKNTVESFSELGSINLPDVVLDDDFIKNKNMV